MEFIKILWKNRKLTWQLGRNDFRNRFANTSLGAIWGFIQPFVFMVTYAIVFQFILKTGSSNGAPYAVWFIPGMSAWMTLNDSIMQSSNSIRMYSYLVKKVVFPVDTIPIISIISTSFTGIFLFVIAIGISLVYKIIPNFLVLIYGIIAMYAFIISFTRLTSAICTLVPDFGQLLTVFMQLFMWFTPIIWNITMVSGHNIISTVVKCMPFTYIVQTIRSAFLPNEGYLVGDNNWIYTVVFWSITLLIFIWGNATFKRNKKDFADVL